ncbi:MAG: LPS export ABC transporter periplasmic protein LptC [Aphanocapsa lilacina HA4352-LM1]|jgi:LPS export ABC transporter protein LptC|nr:LPS export ABC transporter periplasmic protein LptC [Aphanocapsa lilacina HA4352-LM1]
MSRRHRAPAAFACLLLAACSGPPEPTPSQANESPLVLQNIVLSETTSRGGALVWELKARRAEYSRDRSSASIQQIRGVFYEQGRKVLTVEAPRGEVRIAAREILLTGGVKALAPVRETAFDAERVQWFADRNRLEATGPVELRQPKDRVRVRGKRLVGDLAAQIYTLDGGVEGDSAVQKIALSAPSLTWSLRPNHVTAAGSVTVRDLARQIRLVAPRAVWQVDQNRVVAAAEGNRPVTAEQPASAARLRARQVVWDIPGRTLSGTGQVHAEIGRPVQVFDAARATYRIADHVLVAGDGRYRKPGENTSLEGPVLEADFARSTVRASGGRVVTRILPDTIQK